MARSFRLLVTMALVAAAACGGGNGGGEDDGTLPEPTPLATATALPTAVPTATPEPVATPPAFPEVQLAAGISYSGEREELFILRKDRSRWEGTRFDPPRLALLRGVTFSSADVAWAFGILGNYESPVLFRSNDEGRTWMNVAGTLPPTCKGIEDLDFADAHVGYLVSRGLFSAATAFVTRDGGGTWARVEIESPPLPGSYALGTRGTAAELLRNDGAGTGVVRLDAPALPSVTLFGAIGGNNGFATDGPAGWITLTLTTRATIVTSRAPGEPWLEQLLEPPRVGPLRAIDVRDERNGVAGGQFALLVMANEAGAWRAASIPDLPSGWNVVDVLRLRGDDASAIATDVTSGDIQSAFFRSTDGGRSWSRDPTGFEAGVRLVDLARNTAVD